MGRKPAKRRDDKAATPQSIKITLRLSDDTAKRLGVEATMRRLTMSAVAEEILAPRLRRWRLPSTVDAPVDNGEPDGQAGRHGAPGRADDPGADVAADASRGLLGPFPRVQ